MIPIRLIILIVGVNISLSSAVFGDELPNEDRIGVILAMITRMDSKMTNMSSKINEVEKKVEAVQKSVGWKFVGMGNMMNYDEITPLVVVIHLQHVLVFAPKSVLRSQNGTACTSVRLMGVVNLYSFDLNHFRELYINSLIISMLFILIDFVIL